MSDPPEHNQAAPRQRPVLCPYRHIDTLCNMLNGGAKSAVTAVGCHAFGEEKRITCLDCEEGPFESCVVYLHGGCSNCIITGREESCMWQQLEKRDSSSKRDHATTPEIRSNETRRPGPKKGAEIPAEDSPCSNRPRRRRHAETPTDDPRPSKRRNTSDAESDDDGLKLSPFYDLTGDGN